LTLQELATGGAPLRRIDPPVVLAHGQIHIWQLDLDRPPERVEALAALLCDSERQRAQRFHFDRHRNRYIARRAGLRRILAGYMGVDAQSVTFVENKFGKPRLDQTDEGQGLCFNASHCENRSLCVLARDRGIGSDLETCSRSKDIDWPQLSKQFIHPREQAYLLTVPSPRRAAGYLKLWTLKEAFAKALGSGLSLELTELDASGALAGDRAFRVHRQGRHWLFHSMQLDADAIASIVVADR
jgi:4'-phosphopantetheinyl transferase